MRVKTLVLQAEVNPDDSEWNYPNVRIPTIQKSRNAFSDKQKIPIKFINVTAEKGIVLQIVEQSTNRVLSKDSPEKFIGISFEEFQFKEPYRKHTATYIEKLLKAGIRLNYRTYHFYGHSNSQLKTKTCYLFEAANGVQLFRKINELGDFSKIASIAKRAKRIGLLFSAAESQIQLNEKKTLDIEDIEENGHIFTDGCGLIDRNYAKYLASRQYANIIFHNCSYTPSVYQIRYKGYKGTLMTFPHLEPPYVIHFRASMKKFKSCPDDTFSILDYSKPYTFGFLNGELVTLLSTLGISDDILLRKQAEYFNFLKTALADPKTAFIFLSYKGENKMAENVLLNGISAGVSASIRRLQKEEWKGCYDKRDKAKVRIMIPESRLLYGVCDYTGTLREGEVHVRIAIEGKGVRSLDNAYVIVGRNPCLHPGDIRKFKAVRCDNLNHLEECIVFPVVGERDAPSLMSGGDLDGDRFFVSWDKDIIPETLYEAYGYPPAKEAPRREIKHEDMIRYFAHYNNAPLGKLKNLYLRWLKVSEDVAGSKECQQLNALFSCGVDGEKIRIPDILQNPPEPPAGKEFILDALCQAVNKHANEEFQADTEGTEETPKDLLEDLLISSADICLNEFEFFQMASRCCKNKNEPLENYLHCFDFGAFTFQQRHLAASQFEKSVHKDKIFGMIFNGLLSSKLLTPTELRQQNLDDKRIYWQKLYSSEDDDGLRLQSSITKALEMFDRKFIVLRVDDNLRIAMYIPVKLVKGEELFIGKLEDSVKLFAFTDSTGDIYKTWTKRDYKLYFDGDMFQLFDKNRPNTFVWFGLQNGKFPSRKPDTEFKVSIALQKFDQQLMRSRSKVNKQESKGAEIYVISNRDRVGHQILDITMSQKETTEIKRLLRNIPKEYNLALDFDGISWENREFCQQIILNSDFAELKRLSSISQWDQIFCIYYSLSDEKFTLTIDYVIKNFNAFKLKTEIWRAIFGWIHKFPSASSLIVEALYESSLKNSLIFPMEDYMYTCLVHAIFQCANFAKHLVLKLFQKLIQVLLHKNVAFSADDLTKMVKWIVYCVRHVDVAQSLLDELFNEENRIFKFAEGEDNEICFKYLKHFTMALAKDYLGETCDKCPCDSHGIPQGAEEIQYEMENDAEKNGKTSNKSRLEQNRSLSDFIPHKTISNGESLSSSTSSINSEFRGKNPVPEMKCLEISPTAKLGFYKTNLRTDVFNKIRTGDHLRFCASRRSMDDNKKRITVFNAIADSIQNGVLTFEMKQKEPRELFSASWNIYICASTTTFSAMLVAMNNLIALKEKSTTAFRSILGLPQNGERVKPIEFKEANIPPGKFNENQELAIKEALNNPLTLVWGPPGTGKTTVIVEILLQFLLKRGGLRILVSASTHNAVDNVLSRFLKERKSRFGEEEESTDVVRIASDTGKVSAEMKKWTLDAFVGANIHTNNKAKNEAQKRLNNATFVFSTCSGAGVGLLRPLEENEGGGGDDNEEGGKNKKKHEQKFDVVVVDEASQITEPNALIPIVKNSAFVILVGDHEQLRPTVSEIAKESGLETSLFEKLYTSNLKNDNCKRIMLNLQYRMHEQLAKFPSKAFYKGRLMTGVKHDARIIPESKFPWPLIEGVKFPTVFVHCSSPEKYGVGSTSKMNDGQCELTIKIIKALNESSESPQSPLLSITVLSPYTKQVSEIRQKVATSRLKIDVETVDSFQGRESDIIIYSSVVANKHNRLGFLDDARRMNVALTRAKYGLILIGNMPTLMANELWKECISSCQEVEFPKNE